MKQQKSFVEKYQMGEENLSQQNWSNLRIEGGCLTNIDLSGSDLSCATLIDVDLTEANFKKCCLKGARLKGCNLTGANFDGADLSHVNLNNSILTKARLKQVNLFQAHLSNTNLTNAYVVNSSLIGVSLNNSDLSFANFKQSNLSHGFFTGSNLNETNFKEAIFYYASLIGIKLRNTFFKDAKYNSKTLFDKSFNPVDFGMKKGLDITIQELINSLNYLLKVSTKYLGKNFSLKYLENSKPDYQWINQFKIMPEGLVKFDGNVTYFINYFELKWYQEWVKKYIENCSFLFKDFAHLIDFDQIIHYPLDVNNLLNFGRQIAS